MSDMNNDLHARAVKVLSENEVRKMEHCLDHADDCPEECFRGQLVKDLKSSNQCMEVSWMSFKGTDECPKENETWKENLE